MATRYLEAILESHRSPTCSQGEQRSVETEFLPVKGLASNFVATFQNDSGPQIRVLERYSSNLRSRPI